MLENVLGNGKMTFVLVFAEWCGACKKFMKNVWGPMCKKGAIHNRIAVRDDMVSKTALANTKFNYLPSIIVVNEAGAVESFDGPEGPTNAMPTPQSLEEMVRVVNVPIASASASSPNAVNANTNVNANSMQTRNAMVSAIVRDANANKPLNVKNLLALSPVEPIAYASQNQNQKQNQKQNQNSLQRTNEGIVYMPTPAVASQQPFTKPGQRGGRLSPLFKRLASAFRRTRKSRR